MKKLFFIFICFMFSSFVPDDDLIFVTSIKINPDFFTTDPLGNIYTVEGSEIKKYSCTGELLQTFSDKNRGAIYSVDASNPLKILVFYKDFRQIVFLSSNMTINGDPIILDDLNIAQPLLVCTSSDNNFWVYDHQNMNLTRYDVKLEVTAQSSNISTVSELDENPMKPNYIEEQSGILYLNVPQTGILEFDKFGTFNKTIPLNEISAFQPENSNIFYLSGDTLCKYISKKFETIKLKLPDQNIKKVRLAANYVYIQIEGEIRIYKAIMENKE